jgi:RimJ/RimL family protein N-acetyltransferase
MNIETERIIIRSIRRGDEKAYAEMAKDGSLAEIGFDESFSDWAEDWINEAVTLTISYFFDHYNEKEIIATIKDNNIPSWKTAEKCGFELTETKMYKDLDDEKEELYRFYKINR